MKIKLIRNSNSNHYHSLYTTKLGRGGVLGQGKGSGSWEKKRLMGILAVTGYGSNMPK